MPPAIRFVVHQEAGNAVRWGLPWEAALRAVMLTPAEIYGVADRYGALELGHVATSSCGAATRSRSRAGPRPSSRTALEIRVAGDDD